MQPQRKLENIVGNDNRKTRHFVHQINSEPGGGWGGD